MNNRFLLELEWKKPLEEESYLAALPAVSWLAQQGRLPLDAPVTFFVGENGAGKSTLLEALAVSAGFNAEGGSRNFSFASKQTHSGLWQNLRLVRGAVRPADGFFLRAESFYNVASEIDRLEEELPGMLKSYGGQSLHEQSHGESFLSLLLHRFVGGGLYLLDEPEAALSPSRQLSLLARLDMLVREGSQFVIASHSPILMAYPDAVIYLFSEEGIRRVAYRETEHYQLTWRFLDNPERMLRYLLEK